MYRRSHGVRRRGLRRCTEIKLDTSRDEDLETLRVELNAPPTRRAVRDGEKAPVTSANGDEGTVVAGEAKRPADGGVNESPGAARDVNRERDSVEETPRNADRLAGATVQGRQLGVLPEAAGKQIDRAQRTDELAASTRKRCRIGDTKNGAGPERAQPRGGDHEPPETTTGGACVADGAGAGVGAGGDAAARFPGPGAAGSGGIALLERADAAICRAFGSCDRRADAPERSLWPGAEAAAIPAKRPLRIADTVRAPPVNMRVRAASASRAAARCIIPSASRMGQVEQRSMNGL